MERAILPGRPLTCSTGAAFRLALTNGCSTSRLLFRCRVRRTSQNLEVGALDLLRNLRPLVFSLDPLPCRCSCGFPHCGIGDQESQSFGQVSSISPHKGETGPFDNVAPQSRAARFVAQQSRARPLGRSILASFRLTSLQQTQTISTIFSLEWCSRLLGTVKISLIPGAGNIRRQNLSCPVAVMI